ncbi:hypothetical protein ACT7DH_05935 [Bacillus pacificus]
MEQVIGGLFTNAIRYTDAKQIIVIDVKRNNTDKVYIGFENKGSHIAEENMIKYGISSIGAINQENEYVVERVLGCPL